MNSTMKYKYGETEYEIGDILEINYLYLDEKDLVKVCMNNESDEDFSRTVSLILPNGWLYANIKVNTFNKVTKSEIENSIDGDCEIRYINSSNKVDTFIVNDDTNAEE